MAAVKCSTASGKLPAEKAALPLACRARAAAQAAAAAGQRSGGGGGIGWRGSAIGGWGTRPGIGMLRDGTPADGGAAEAAGCSPSAHQPTCCLLLGQAISEVQDVCFRSVQCTVLQLTTSKPFFQALLTSGTQTPDRQQQEVLPLNCAPLL